MSARKLGIIDEKGSIICLAQYRWIDYDFMYGLLVVQNNKKQWGIVDQKGNITIFPEKYEKIVLLSSKLIAVAVKVNRKIKWGLIATSGKKLCDPKYSYVPEAFYGTKYWSVVLNGKAAIINEKGHQFCGARYDEVRILGFWHKGNGEIAVTLFAGRRNHRWYGITRSGREIEDIPYNLQRCL